VHGALIMSSETTSTPTTSTTPSTTSTTQITDSKVQTSTTPNIESKVGSSTENQDDVYYFAIGSMINPVSISLRDVHPKKTYPAELHGYKLVFTGMAGMASIEPQEGAVTHGVVHVLSQKGMAILDQMESIYIRIPCEVRLYDGSTMKAGVYQMDPKKMTTKQQSVNSLPGERYIDIITRGAIHYGLKVEFIQWLSTVKVTPRKAPKDFNKIDEPEGDLTMTFEELEKFDGNDGRDLMFSVNYKIMKFVGDMNNPDAKNTYENIKRRAPGKDLTISTARGLYEPRYPIASTVDEMSEEHRGWVEDLFCMWLNNKTFYKVIGRIAKKKINNNLSKL